MIKRYLAAMVVAASPLAVAGLVVACEMEYLPLWATGILMVGIIWAAWWGMNTMDNEEEEE